jgi:hypothetical protein
VSSRAKWLTAIFLTLTAGAVGWEIVAVFDGSADTWPWTQLIVQYVPEPVTNLAIDVPLAWLPAHFLTNYADARKAAAMAQPLPVTPTQTKHPVRAVLRTVAAGIVAALPLIPLAVAGLHLDSTAVGAEIILVGGLITRVLAYPAVNGWLQTYVPFLAASPATP